MTTSIFSPLPVSTSGRCSVAEVNLDRLRELAGQLRNAVRELREIGGLGRDSFLRDRRLVNSAKYLLIVAAEAALDICNHLAARRGGRSPRDYADCIEILGELGAVDDELRARLVKIARFRNLLVHLYWKVDDGEVCRVIQEDLEDLDAYLASLGRYLDLHRQGIASRIIFSSRNLAVSSRISIAYTRSCWRGSALEVWRCAKGS